MNDYSLHIGHITTDYLPITGGAEAYVNDLINILQPAEQMIYQLDTGIVANNIRPVWHLPEGIRRRSSDVWLYGLFLMRYIKELKHQDALIIHYGLYYPLLSWHSKSVVVSHGVEWIVPPNTISHRIRKWAAKKAFKSACSLVANDSDFYRQMGLNIAPGEALFQEVAPGRWFIPNCVDTDIFKPTVVMPELKDIKAILVPRNIHPRRGVHLAVRALPRILQAHPELKLVIAGQFVDHAYRTQIVHTIDELKLHDSIIFLGSVPRQDMPLLYSSTLLTVVPSILGEGTSLAALESMACGTPTISTSIGGLADLPTEKCLPDERSLAEVVIDVLQRRDEVAKCQKEIVRQHFNISNWRNTWRRVLEMD